MKPIPPSIVGLCTALRGAGHQAFLVGGAIRDLLLDRPAHDFDIATSATPVEVARVFGRKRTIPTGEQHGTVTVLLESDGERTGVEVTTFRGEGPYRDGRRPDSVQFVSDITEDLRRRDFTVNAIALDPLGNRLVDPFGGQEDLAAHRLRAVGDPVLRFGEDGLRVLRAARLAAQLEFALDPATEAAIFGALPILRKVSQERVRDELWKTLAAVRPSLGLTIMQRTGILAVILPELTEGVGLAQNRFHAHDVFEHTLHTVDETGGGPVVRMGALLHDIAKPRTAAPKPDAPGEHTFFRHEAVGAEMADGICRRLKVSNQDRERIVALVGHHMFWYTPEWTDATVRRFIGRVGVELLPDLFALREGDVRARGHGEDPAVEVAELKERIGREIEAQRALKVTDLAVGGGDVMRLLGCPPGRLVGEVLKALLERVIDEPALNTQETLEKLLPEVAQEIMGQRSS